MVDDQQSQNMFFPSMPAQVAPIQPGNMSDTIASMRWESDTMIINLRVRLGGYVVTANKDGQTLLQRPVGVVPLVNDIGIDRFVAIIHGVVSPVVALSNIDDDEANTLIRQILYDIIFDLVYNKDRFEVHNGDMRSIMSIMKTIVFMQVKRPVGGHESHNFRTQTIEQSVNQSMNAPQQHGSIFNPFSWGRKP